jgi:hypothetical protein
MKERNILFSVPTNAGIDPHTSLAIARICRRDDITYIPVMGSPTDQVRNGLVKIVLHNPDFTHLLMMDSDISPPENIVDLLLECDSPMAAAIVPIMLQNKIVSNVIIDNEHGSHFMESWNTHGDIIEAEGVGTGVVLIRREVFENIPWPWFRYEEGEHDGKRTGEDIFFSRKAAEHGYKYKVHPRALCGHYKTVNLLTIIEAVRSNMQERTIEVKATSPAQEEAVA